MNSTATVNTNQRGIRILWPPVTKTATNKNPLWVPRSKRGGSKVGSPKPMLLVKRQAIQTTPPMGVAMADGKVDARQTQTVAQISAVGIHYPTA